MKYFRLSLDFELKANGSIGAYFRKKRLNGVKGKECYSSMVLEFGMSLSFFSFCSGKCLKVMQSRKVLIKSFLNSQFIFVVFRTHEDSEFLIKMCQNIFWGIF